MLIATNRKENEMGDMFSLAARIRFFESAADDNCVPLKIATDERVREGARNEHAEMVSTTSTRFTLEHGMSHLLAKPGGKSKESVDLNLSRAKHNSPLLVVQHLATSVSQLVTLSGMRLFCNEYSTISRVILYEVNLVLFRVLEPFLSADVNEEDRFVRKQEGLMHSYAIPMHVQLLVMRHVMREMVIKDLPSLDVDVL
eukprot:762952-Hanusia_phi.AAC.6